MMQLCSLFSGSSGNCTYIESENAAILIDAGMPMKSIFNEIKRIGKNTDKIKAVFVTHEHSDHIKGLGAVARYLKVPVYATKNTWRAMYKSIGKIEKHNIKPIETGEQAEIEDMVINAFSIPHDAAGPCGYTVLSGRQKMAVSTDLGEMTEEVFSAINGSECVLLESNHDIDMLMKGQYPYFLKRRIIGNMGHLSNKTASETAAKLACNGTKVILLGHLSAENNKPEIAMSASFDAIEKAGAKVGRDVELEVLCRGGKGRLITI